MTLLSPNHNYAADECIAQIPQHHIPTQEEKVRASESFDKSVLVAAHMAALHDAYILEMATHPVNEVNIKPASPTSSIGGLKPSTLKLLKIGKVHRRRVVKGTLCSKTLCTKSHNGLMVVNVFEDEEGNATPIYLTNAMEGNGGSAQAQRCYPQDSKVAVKEPYLTRLPDGEVVLLVEKMTDMVFLWVPDYVEENEGSKGDGMYKDGREVFAMEKGEDDEMPKSDSKGEVNGNVPEDIVTAEDVKSSSASWELKFDDLMGAKGEVMSKIQDDEKVQKVKTSDAVAVEDEGGNDNTNLDDDPDQKVGINNEDQAKEETKSDEVSREVNVEDILLMRKNEGDNGDEDRAKEETKPDEVSREVNVEDIMSMRKNEVGINNEDQAKEETKPDEVSREVNVEDIVSMRKNEGDNGDEGEVKVGDGEADKALETIGEDSKGVADIDGDCVDEDVAKQEVQQAKPVGDIYAGETAASLRTKGNALFARGEYNKATDIYKRAAEKAQLDKLKNEEVLCLSNRAEVWLRLCRNQVALDDAEAALKILRELEEDGSKGDLTLAKTLFRKGRALMGLHKYEDAMRVLQEVLAKAPADRQLREAATKCRDRLQRVLKPGKRQRASMNRKKSASFMTQ